MTRTITLYLLMCLFSSFQVDAQYWLYPAEKIGQNPENLNKDSEFPVGGGLPAGWTTIIGPNATPRWSANRTIPFTFNFNGAPVTNYKVSNSGILTFDVTTVKVAPSFDRDVLPNVAIPDKSVCIWGLGGIGPNDNIITKNFGTAPKRQHWIQFNSYGYGTVPSDGQSYCYWSIVLEEGSNKIYIVDHRSNGYADANFLSAGVQINETDAIVVTGSPDFVSLAGFDATPIDNSFYAFIPGTQPAYDLSAVKITTDAYQITGDVVITGSLFNFGTEIINSFDLHYTVDFSDTVTTHISGTNITTFESYEFVHPDIWKAPSGTAIIDVWASNINGKDDEVMSNDHFGKSIFVLTEYLQRIPLFEIFTSSTCAPCKPGNENFHGIVDSRPQEEFITIKYQQDFPGTGDPYATNELVNRRAYYAINSIPRMEIDGKWDKNSQSFTDALYDEYKAIPAAYKLWGNYTQNDKAFNTKVYFSPLFSSTGAKLFVAILEHNTFNNVKTNGEGNFTQVTKKMLPTETGTNLKALNPGDVDSLGFNFTFAGNYRLPLDGQAANRIVHSREHSVEDFNNLYAVAWIQGPDKVVYQAAVLNKNIIIGTDDFSNTIGTVEVYPNPAADVVNISYESTVSDQVFITMVDLMGNVVSSKQVNAEIGKQTVSISTREMPIGLYYVMLFDSKNNAAIHEVSIIR